MKKLEIKKKVKIKNDDIDLNLLLGGKSILGYFKEIKYAKYPIWFKSIDGRVKKMP